MGPSYLKGSFKVMRMTWERSHSMKIWGWSTFCFSQILWSLRWKGDLNRCSSSGGHPQCNLVLSSVSFHSHSVSPHAATEEGGGGIPRPPGADPQVASRDQRELAKLSFDSKCAGTSAFPPVSSGCVAHPWLRWAELKHSHLTVSLAVHWAKETQVMLLDENEEKSPGAPGPAPTWPHDLK